MDATSSSCSQNLLAVGSPTFLGTLCFFQLPLLGYFSLPCSPPAMPGAHPESWWALVGCSCIRLSNRIGGWVLQACRWTLTPLFGLRLVTVPRQDPSQSPAWEVKAWPPAFLEWVAEAGLCFSIPFVLLFVVLYLCSQLPDACSLRLFLPPFWEGMSFQNNAAISYWGCY